MTKAAEATPADIVALDIAFKAALMARPETLLARLPRLLKLIVTGLLLVFLIGGGVTFWPKARPYDGSGVSAEGHDDEAPEMDLAAIPTTLDPKAGEERRMPESPEEIQGAEANDNNNSALDIAPDMGLVEETAHGYLPRIGDDGRRPWQVYAKDFDYRDPRPRVCIVIGDLGFSRVATDAALHRLPTAVTLAFDVQGVAIDEWITRARQDGHESIIVVPMEPSDFPRSDPGPNSLLTTLPNSDNLERLRTALRAGQGFVGITTLSGSRFVTDPQKVEPILEELRRRGLLLLDARVSPHSVWGEMARKMKVPLATSLRFIDSTPTPQAIDAALAQLEKTARVEGVAVAMASPLPVTIERLEVWARTLRERGIVLTPLSSIVR